MAWSQSWKGPERFFSCFIDKETSLQNFISMVLLQPQSRFCCCCCCCFENLGVTCKCDCLHTTMDSRPALLQRYGQDLLRCGPSVFAGHAGYRLPLPASFPAGLPLGEQPPEGQWQHRAEIQIARKLQCIADQFHRLHMQQVGTGAWWGEVVCICWGCGAGACLSNSFCQAPRLRPHVTVILLNWKSRMGLAG